ncbi:MAG: endolytic transglycosylase MltG [Clostridia bacterium]|nr:endolytic transglycosylase MltG [Clostridia bacterium]
MDDKKRNITGSYPGKGGAQPKTNRNPSGSYPGKKRWAEEPTRVVPKAEATREMPKAEPIEEPILAAEEPVVKKEPAPKKKKIKLSKLFSKDMMGRYWKTLAYYSCILVVSVLLAAWLCHVGNEVLGLIRPDKEITVTIPEKSGLPAIAKELKKADIIDHPNVFMLYCKLKKAGGDFQSGEFTVNCKGDYNQLIRTLRRNTANKTKVSFTIEPGDTQEDLVVTLCDSLGYLEREELESVLQTYDFSDYSFLKKLPKRNYRLEGYLYPGTYEMYEGESALAVVQRILDKFQEMVLTNENNIKIHASEYSLDELITLASIVQAEAGSELPRAAAVYFNRLKDKDFPYLQSQATVRYILPAGHGAVNANDIRTDDPYNTYRNSGLPTGPIMNPGADAIAAVLDPADSEDLYFVTQSDGKTLYSADKAGWQSNLKKAGENARGTGTVS